MPVYHPKKFNLQDSELPDELPINLKAFQDVQPDFTDAPKPVNPSKIMVLRMLVIMGALGAIFMVLSMVSIVLGW